MVSHTFAAMLKYPVIAAFISNLTDARYFAARGVDYLLYDLSQIHIPQIEEIQKWVSGPKALLLFSTDNLTSVDEAIIKFAPAAIAMKEESNTLIAHLSGHVTLFEWTDNEIELDGIFFKPFEYHNGSENMGIILSGENEEIVGIKSYDELDDILDQLES